MSPAVVEAHGVSIAYGGFQALTGVDLTCQAGEFIAIVGRSGTGKTSFLNAVAGLIPYEGKIDVRAPVGYVFQHYALFPWMTVEKNIEFGLSDRPPEERRRRVREMLSRIELAEQARRYPSQLSGGQIQRVALARTLAPDPEILLMDEPYAALDHLTRERMQSWLLSIWQETKKTVLFVTHYIEEAVFLADRIVVVRDSRFVANLEIPFPRPRHEDMRFMERFLDVKHEVLAHMG